MVHLPTATLEQLSTDASVLLLENARLLQHASDTHAPLRGTKLALLCESEEQEDASLFRSAAADLGAHVSFVRPSLSDLSPPDVVQHTARMLGRLYDAIECQGLPQALVKKVGLQAGVPVYNGLATSHHPTARLAELLGGEEARGKSRELVLKSALLSTLT